MPIGTEIDLRKPPMEQRRPEELSVQIRAMQLEMAAMTQRERSAVGERDRAVAELQAFRDATSTDQIDTLRAKVRELETKVLQLRQEAGTTRLELSRLASVAEASVELESLRKYRDEQEKRDAERDLTLNLERQRTEQHIRELTAKLEAAQRKGGKR